MIFPDWTRDPKQLEETATGILQSIIAVEGNARNSIDITYPFGNDGVVYLLGRFVRGETGPYEWRPLDEPAQYSPGPLFKDVMPEGDAPKDS